MAYEIQHADGSVSQNRERDGAELSRAGGVPDTLGTIPAFLGGFTLDFQINGGTDTAGGLLSWKNTLGYDIMVVAHVVDVETVATSACTASFGQTATSGTTSASNMLSGTDVHSSAAPANGGALSVKVPVNTWITGSKASGASAGLQGHAYFFCIRAGAAATP